MMKSDILSVEVVLEDVTGADSAHSSSGDKVDMSVRKGLGQGQDFTAEKGRVMKGFGKEETCLEGCRSCSNFLCYQ